MICCYLLLLLLLLLLLQQICGENSGCYALSAPPAPPASIELPPAPVTDLVHFISPSGIIPAKNTAAATGNLQATARCCSFAAQLPALSHTAAGAVAANWCREQQWLGLTSSSSSWAAAQLKKYLLCLTLPTASRPRSGMGGNSRPGCCACSWASRSCSRSGWRGSSSRGRHRQQVQQSRAVWV
jgi:hypothetical protein